MTKTAKQKLWDAWCIEALSHVVDDGKGDRTLAYAEVIGLTALGIWSNAVVPRLPFTGSMTLPWAARLLPTLKSFSVADINAAAEAAAGAIPAADSLDFQQLISVLQARDFLLGKRDEIARVLAAANRGEIGS